MNIFIRAKHFAGEFSRNIHLSADLGVINALRLIWWRYKKVVEPNKANYWERRKYNFLYQYISDRYSHLIDTEFEDNTGGIEPIIWIFWWQGEDAMPIIVKKCFESVKRNANGIKVQLLTKYNYQQFVDIPDIILKKVESGIISYVHFSDIYRSCLLYKLGGLWLDATILVTDLIPSSIFKRGFFSMKKDPSDGHYYAMKYSSFCFGIKKRNLLFKNISKIFLEYVAKEKYFIDYFLINIIIQVIIDKSSYCKELVDSLEYNNPDMLSIQNNFNNPYDESVFRGWLKNTMFFKLTYKGAPKIEVNGVKTFYGHILDCY